MNLVQVHLALNHLPVIGMIFGLGALLAAKVKKSVDLQQFAWGVFVFTALSTIPVFFTGEPAEDIVMGLPGISKAVIEAHEEGAMAAFIVTGVVGLMSLMALYRSRHTLSWPRWAELFLLIGVIVASVLMARTAHLGGLIRHPELNGISSGSAKL